MSSRDRMNPLENSSSRSRPGPSSGQDRADDSDQDFWDIDQDELDEHVDDEPAQASPTRTPRRTRTSAPSSSGTAQQIDRLRNTLGQGRSSGRSLQQSVGRNYLPRSPREAAPVEVVDDSWDEEEDWEQPAMPRRTRVARNTPPLRQRSRDTDIWVDSDDDHYYDDDDDFDEYDAPPRRTPLTQAPSIRLPRPNVTRPTMPSVISQADLVNDAPALAMIGLGLISLAGMAILVANRADTLAPSFATHVSASGVLEDVRDPNALWRLPLLATMLTLMNIGSAWFISPVDRFASRFLIAAAIIVQVVTWVALIRIL